MSQVPDNDVLKLYEEVSNLRKLVEAQNKKINERDKQIELFMKNTNFAISKIQVVSEAVKTISEILPILNTFFAQSKGSNRI